MSAAKSPANMDKFRELVLYIAEKSQDDPGFGKTKLNKLLFAADFAQFQATGVALTGIRYQKLEFGPAPRPLLPVLRELEAEGYCRVISGTFKNQKRVVATREPDLSLFTSSEIARVDDVLEDFRNPNATAISDWSHNFIGWRLAENGEDIPYETILVADARPLTEDEITYGLGLAEDEPLSDRH